MFIIILVIVLIYFFVCIVKGVVQYATVPKPPNKLSYKDYYSYYQNREWETDDTTDEVADIHRQERIDLADETILKYNRLLDSLVELYKSETDEKKRVAILAKQTITLEKLQRALEKREKLDS